MLNVQRHLKEENLRNTDGFQSLEQLYGISSTFHPTDNRVILNYSQINSPKTNDIVKECRGLVLDKTNFNIVAKSFSRFFNLGEVKGECDNFIFKDSIATHKEDGSLILLYYYNNAWHVNTRGSFADSKVNGLNFTWRQLFFSALHNHSVINHLDKEVTYVFELCTPYTQIVRIYSEPVIYLLTMFHNELGFEFTHDTVDGVASVFGFKRPKSMQFNDQFETVMYIAKLVEVDKTFEGVVLRDKNNLRIKVKSEEYVKLHRLSNNRNISSPARIAEIILAGEQDEVLTYFPFLALDFESIGAKIKKMLKEMDDMWFCYHDIVSQRHFADKVKKHPLSGILFKARQLKTVPAELLKDKNWQDVIINIISKENKQ